MNSDNRFLVGSISILLKYLDLLSLMDNPLSDTTDTGK